MVERHKTLSSYLCQFKDEWASYLHEVKEDGGWALHLRSMTAHLLWLFLIIQIAVALTPIRDFVSRLALAGAVLLILTIVWQQVIKERLPKHTVDFLDGKFVYTLDCKPLNKVIVTLLVLNAAAGYWNYRPHPKD